VQCLDASPGSVYFERFLPIEETTQAIVCLEFHPSFQSIHEVEDVVRAQKVNQ
jgi:hypothetical protein